MSPFPEYPKSGYLLIYHYGIIKSRERGGYVRLKELRKKKGLSQLRLATDLNTTQNTISRYETGEREPGIDEMIKIADYFNVSVDYLIGRTENPKINR